MFLLRSVRNALAAGLLAGSAISASGCVPVIVGAAVGYSGAKILEDEDGDKDQKGAAGENKKSAKEAPGTVKQ